MLNNLSKYIYFCLVTIFTLFIGFTIFWEKVILNNNLIYLFTIILIPFFDYLLKFLNFNYKDFLKLFSLKYIYRYFILFLVFISLKFYSFSYLNIFLILYLLFWLLFNFKSHLSYLTSLILFIYTLIYYFIWNVSVSSFLFVYSFYFIFIWIGFEISNFLAIKNVLVFNGSIDIDNIKKKVLNIKSNLFKTTYDYIYLWIVIIFLFLLSFEIFKFLFWDYSLYKVFLIFVLFSFIFITKKVIEKNTFISSAFILIKKNKEKIFNFWLIFYFFIFVISFLFDTWKTFEYTTFVFLSIYILLTFCWYSFNFIVKKINPFSLDFFNVFVFFWSILYIFIHKLINIYWLSTYNSLITFSIYFIVFISFILLFSEKKRLKTILVSNTYNILSFIFILILIWVILFKNWTLKLNESSETLWNNSENEEILINTWILSNDGNNIIEDEIVKEEIKEEIVIENKKISDIFEFKTYLNLWHEWEDVKMLQDLLQSMWYYNFEITWKYDGETKKAVKDMLINECDWPETTLWVFWVQAMECFNNLEIKYETRIN